MENPVSEFYKALADHANAERVESGNENKIQIQVGPATCECATVLSLEP